MTDAGELKPVRVPRSVRLAIKAMQMAHDDGMRQHGYDFERWLDEAIAAWNTRA